MAQKLHANLFYTRLTAHGLGAEAFSNVSVNDWFNDVNEALEIGKKMGNRLILIGMSTGAPLVIWAVQMETNIAAVVLMSPNFGVANKEAGIILWPWGNLISHIMVGDYYGYKSVNPLHEKYWTSKYRIEGLQPMMALVEYGRNADYSKITLPALFLYSENDEVIDLSQMKMSFQKLSSKQKKLVNVPGARQHVIAGDILSPWTTDFVVRTINDFLKENLLY